MSVCGNSWYSASNAGVFARRMALPSFSARSPKPSRTTNTVRFTLRSLMSSGPVVGLAAQDAERTVELLEDNKASEPMRQRQPSERPREVGPRHEIFGQPVGAADDHGDALLAAVHGALQDLRELLGAELFAARVERPQLVAGGDLANELGVVLDLDEVQRELAAHALGVLGAALLDPGLLQLPDGENAELHIK